MPKIQKRNALMGAVHSRAESMTPSQSKEDDRRLTFTIVSPNNDGKRYDWGSGEYYTERLDVNGANSERLNTFFKDHNRGVDDAIGRVESVRVDGDSLMCDVIFGSDADSILNKYREGILTDVSIGYAINDYTVEKREGDTDLVTITDYTILELSAVGIGFDIGAKHERSSENEDKQKLREIGESLNRAGKILN